ncbi:hypothetical protein LX36DRAFT_144224 [Colletotrichum falcatum]|nr:hypothetical protein LX36DRAFT_144224 [Colletotrichum falcatum]
MPSYFSETAVPPKYAVAHAVMYWRLLKRVSQTRKLQLLASANSGDVMIRTDCYRGMLSLIPCVCIRNETNSRDAPDWREQVTTTIRCIVTPTPAPSAAAKSSRASVEGSSVTTLSPLVCSDADHDDAQPCAR